MALTKVQKEGIETLINNNADNRVITGSGTANTLNGESTLTYSGDTLLSTNSNFVIKSIDTNASNAENYIQFNAGYITYDSDSSNSTGYSGHYFQADGAEKLRINGSGQLIFDADTNTYIARPAADTLAVTTGGTERLRIDSSGRLLLGTTTQGFSTADDLTIATSADTGVTIRSGTSNQGNIFFADGTSGTDEYKGIIQYDHSADALRLYSNASERIRIDSSGNVGIGVVPKSGQYSGYNHLQVGECATLSSNDTNSDTNITSLIHNAYLDATASNWKYLHSDEASRYQQYNGIHYFSRASSGTADGNISFADKLKIDSDGIKFNSDTAAANALDDYEEGSFSPTVTGIGGGTNPSFSAQSAMAGYTKVGNIVHCHLYIYDINCSSSGSNIMTIAGLPFASSGRYYPGVITHNTVVGNGNVLSGYVQANNNSPHFIPIVNNSTTGTTANTGNPKYIMASFSYQAQ